MLTHSVPETKSFFEFLISSIIFFISSCLKYLLGKFAIPSFALFKWM